MDTNKISGLHRGSYAFGDPSELLTQKIWELAKRGVQYVVGNKTTIIMPALQKGQTVGIRFTKFESFVSKSGFIAFVPIECLSKKIDKTKLIIFDVYDSCQISYHKDDGFINMITIDGVDHDVI